MPTKIVDDPLYRPPCCHPEHNPPRHVVIPTGKMLVHTCPGCGKETTIRAPLSETWLFQSGNRTA